MGMKTKVNFPRPPSMYNRKKPMACTVGDSVKSHMVFYPLYPESTDTFRQRHKIRKSFPWCRVTAVQSDGFLHLFDSIQGTNHLVSPLTVWAVRHAGGKSM